LIRVGKLLGHFSLQAALESPNLFGHLGFLGINHADKQKGLG